MKSFFSARKLCFKFNLLSMSTAFVQSCLPHSRNITERHDHYMDPAGSSQERDLVSIQVLLGWISHTSGTRTMTVGINTIQVILKGNAHFRQLPEVSGLINELHQAREAIAAQKLADFVRSQHSTLKQQQ